jgi:hypothetical protein
LAIALGPAEMAGSPPAQPPWLCPRARGPRNRKIPIMSHFSKCSHSIQRIFVPGQVPVNVAALAMAKAAEVAPIFGVN